MQIRFSYKLNDPLPVKIIYVHTYIHIHTYIYIIDKGSSFNPPPSLSIFFCSSEVNSIVCKKKFSFKNLILFQLYLF